MLANVGKFDRTLYIFQYSETCTLVAKTFTKRMVLKQDNKQNF